MAAAHIKMSKRRRSFISDSSSTPSSPEIFHCWVCRAHVKDRTREHKESVQSTVFESGEAVNKTNSRATELPESFVRQASSKRWKECLKVFPEERFLQLHYTESHDPLAKQAQERGEKIFECFLPPEQCGKKFSNPKKRRLHMISKHYYPNQFFWAITNQGINEIAKSDGLAISLIRPKRESLTTLPDKPKSHHKKPSGPPHSPGHSSTTSEPPVMSSRRNNNILEAKGQSLALSHVEGIAEDKPEVKGQEGSNMNFTIDDLARGLDDSLTFVPRGLKTQHLTFCHFRPNNLVSEMQNMTQSRMTHALNVPSEKSLPS
ncbi:hypothetical protein L204_105331 [Cryptococcus depauperatus]